MKCTPTPDDEVYVAMRTAMLKVPGSKMIVISSADQGADSPPAASEPEPSPSPRAPHRGVHRRTGTIPTLLEWSLDEDADINDPHVVKRANPAAWITAAGLQEQAEAVQKIAYRRFHCGQWTEREGAWLPAGAWQACVGNPTFTDGERIWVGVDVGGERAATAVVWINEHLHVGCEIFTATKASSKPRTASRKSQPRTASSSSCSIRGGSARQRKNCASVGSMSSSSHSPTRA
jgi:hypothetical protein